MIKRYTITVRATDITELNNSEDQAIKKLGTLALLDDGTFAAFNTVSGLFEGLGSSPEFLVETTYSALAALKTAETLVPGTFYKIIDRGDQGIIIQALSNKELSTKGIRLMNCPFTYEIIGDWLGIWNLDMGLSGIRTIWGGKVWENISGLVGTADSAFVLNASHWVEVPKPGYGATSSAYTTISFEIEYDFENDWISKQRDKYDNEFGITFTEESNYWGYGMNLVDVCDWNINTPSSVIMYANKCLAIFNNSNVNSINKNNTQGNIKGNVSVNEITYNTLGAYGSIDDNNCQGSSISQNIILGSITANSVGGDITNNRGTGIQNNVMVGGISSNNIIGVISGNTSSNIIFNTCRNIQGNTNSGNISGNSNSGNVSSNSNTGSIDLNNNSGNIFNNSNAGNINLNSNVGAIYANINNGYILRNTNTGDIFNNGSSITNIHYNTNNGAISSVGSGAITDTIVNK